MEFEGQSEDEAIQKACSSLQLERPDLDYTVLDEGSGGLFGLGSRPVRIRARVPEGVTPKEDLPADRPSERERTPGIVGPAPEKAEQALSVAKSLAEKMGMNAVVEVRDEETEIVVVINEAEDSTEVADMLMSSKPPALPSFQFLLNKIVNRFPENRKHIVAEAPSVATRIQERKEKAAEEAEARRQRPKAVQKEPPPEDVDPELAELAQQLAEKAVETGKVITIHPMAAGDRRAIHLTIRGIEGVETVSEGDGLYRQMHVVPNALSQRGGKKKRRRRRRRRGPPGAEGEGAEESSPPPAE
jgi:spoIIIJ-associated protein